MMRTLYFHLNKDTLGIVKCSPSPHPDDDNHVAVQIETEENLNGGDVHLYASYFPFFKDGVYGVVKRDSVLAAHEQAVRDGKFMEILPSETTGDVFLLLDSDGKTFTGELSVNRLFGKDRSEFFNTDLADCKTTLDLYFTKKNDPSHLLWVKKVPIALFATIGSLPFEVPVDCSNISVYTKQIASSYSLHFTYAQT